MLDQDAREATRAAGRLRSATRRPSSWPTSCGTLGKLLEPRALLEAVWGYPYLGDANLVHVTLRRLRQELEAGGGSRLIQTVPRGGYVLRQARKPCRPAGRRPVTGVPTVR